MNDPKTLQAWATAVYENTKNAIAGDADVEARTAALTVTYGDISNRIVSGEITTRSQIMLIFGRS